MRQIFSKVTHFSSSFSFFQFFLSFKKKNELNINYNNDLRNELLLDILFQIFKLSEVEQTNSVNWA